MKDSVLEALEFINVSSLSYSEWLQVGMALKAEGYDCSVWENWSRADERYHKGECERKWRGFNGSANPVTGATIVQMAKSRGYAPSSRYEGDGCLGWDDEIEYDGELISLTKAIYKEGYEQLIEYLETLYKSDDIVGYCTTDSFYSSEKEKWMPKNGVYHRTAGELINALKKYKDDIGAAVGDYKKEAGAWIRINPLDGKYVNRENVMAFRYVLVESDEISQEEQIQFYEQWKLPIAALVNSGSKSIHAIVHIDAETDEIYTKRVQFLFDFLKKHNFPIDESNKNPNKYSRMPGVYRGDKMQSLITTNMGCKNYDEWFNYIDTLENAFEEDNMLELFDNPPELAPELIEGLIRLGHKLLLQGPSKSGKSFMLIELSICLAEGLDFIGFKCRKSKVVYINLEIDRASVIHRFKAIYEALGIKKPTQNIKILNLRGKAKPLDELVPKLVKQFAGKGYEAIILDPIYKTLNGDENSASDMAQFTNQFDIICDKLHATAIYAHHHAKGTSGQKSAQDRSSGSGVFARDPDGIIDFSELEFTDEFKEAHPELEYTDTGWAVECITREFKKPRNRNVWFKYPLHIVDGGTLDELLVKGDARLTMKKTNEQKWKEKEKDFHRAYDANDLFGDGVLVNDLVTYLGYDKKTVVAHALRFHYELVDNETKVVRREEVDLEEN